MSKKYNFSCEYRQLHPESKSAKLINQMLNKLVKQTKIVNHLYNFNPSESVINLCHCSQNGIDCTSNPECTWPDIFEWYYYEATSDDIERLYKAGIVYLDYDVAIWVGFTSADGTWKEFTGKLADALYN